MSWGIRITIFYLGFVVLILTLVITCYAHKTELEYKDYYAREINFQEQINASANATRLEHPIIHEINASQITLTLPQEVLGSNLKGSINLLKASNAAADQNIKLQVNENGIQVIDGSKFEKGPYKMQIEFEVNKIKYYDESTINLK